MGVVAWIYAIGSILRLAGNPFFRLAMSQSRFRRRVQRLHRDFYVVCGFGDTGSLLIRGLTDRGISCVILDQNEDRIKALALRDYQAPVVGLCADASLPTSLLDAGVTLPECMGVVALSSDEHVNLKVAVMTRHLNPVVRIICRSTSERHQEELAMLESVEMVDPFQFFARRLSWALKSPLVTAVADVLVGDPKADLRRPPVAPSGLWVICGYGRLGKHLHRALLAEGATPAVIDPRMEDAEDVERQIPGHATDRTLRAAGIDGAVGLVAGTDSDSDNLSILLRARALNPTIFLIVRQNRHENEVAFRETQVDMIEQPSMLAARLILLKLLAPRVHEAFDRLRRQPERLVQKLVDRILELCGSEQPILWNLVLSRKGAPALEELRGGGYEVRLGELLGPAQPGGQGLRCLALSIIRGGKLSLLPGDDWVLARGDEMIMCGLPEARRWLNGRIEDVYRLHHLTTGSELPRSYVFRWLLGRGLRFTGRGKPAEREGESLDPDRA
jgi:Trk K+ transport system NAD-binding subunit